MPSNRRDEILFRVRSGQRLWVDVLAKELGASRETIRRDLSELDRMGLVRRVHGGAVAGVPAGRAPAEGPFHDRMQQQVAAKRAMARHVAAGLRPGDSLFIDTGSTTLFLAERIATCKDLTIITNSAEIADLCQRGPGNRVFLIGGEFRGPGRETVGAMALAQLAGMRAAQAILTVASVTGQGAFDMDLQEAEVARMMIRQAASVTILADASKMGRAGVFEVAPMASVTRIVTNAIPDSLRDMAVASGVTIEIAEHD
jgi:DeoR/GlpR family transcriptional regulator of sugar metabolism